MSEVMENKKEDPIFWAQDTQNTICSMIRRNYVRGLQWMGNTQDTGVRAYFLGKVTDELDKAEKRIVHIRAIVDELSEEEALEILILSLAEWYRKKVSGDSELHEDHILKTNIISDVCGELISIDKGFYKKEREEEEELNEEQETST